MRLLNNITFLETEVLELWMSPKIDTWRSHFFRVVEPLSLLKASRGFPSAEDHGDVLTFPAAVFFRALCKDNPVPRVSEGWHCLDTPVRCRWAGCCTGTTGSAGEHAAPELLPAPAVQCVNTVTSNQGVNLILTRKVKRVLILRPSSYFKITTALNRW